MYTQELFIQPQKQETRDKQTNKQTKNEHNRLRSLTKYDINAYAIISYHQSL